MLTHKERAKIRMEERYRRDLATSMPRNKSKAIFQFFNSNVGIFLLSTIFITLFSWSYNQFTEWQKAKARRQETENHLRLEISQRVRTIRKLKTRFPYIDLNIIRTATYGYRVGSVQVPTHMLIYSPIFEEYGPRSIESLLWELETLVTEPEKSRIREARTSSFHITEYFDKLVQTSEPTASTVDGAEKAYFYELPESEKLNIQQQVFASLDALDLIAGSRDLRFCSYLAA